MDICRYMPQVERLAIWQDAHGVVPDGQRLGCTCKVPYCDHLEHMALVPIRNAHWHNWKPYGKRLLTLATDEYFDIPGIPHDKKFLTRMRTSLAVYGVRFVLRSTREGVRLIRCPDTGRWDQSDIEVSVKRYPYLKPFKTKPFFGIRPGTRYLGYLPGPSMHISDVHTPRCAVRNCPFPPLHGVGEYCYSHNHWFDFGMTMEDKTLDTQFVLPYGSHGWRDGWSYSLAVENPPVPIERLERSLKFDVGWSGKYDSRHRNLGNDAAPVEKPTTSAAKPKNYSQSAASGRRRVGFGKKKIRQSQRRRGAGWSGKRPSHDPLKRWSREELELEANRILGEAAIECNYVPPDEREGGHVYEYVLSEENTMREILAIEQRKEWEKIFSV